MQKPVMPKSKPVVFIFVILIHSLSKRLTLCVLSYALSIIILNVCDVKMKNRIKNVNNNL